MILKNNISVDDECQSGFMRLLYSPVVQQWILYHTVPCVIQQQGEQTVAVWVMYNQNPALECSFRFCRK